MTNTIYIDANLFGVKIYIQNGLVRPLFCLKSSIQFYSSSDVRMIFAKIFAFSQMQMEGCADGLSYCYIVFWCDKAISKYFQIWPKKIIPPLPKDLIIGKDLNII